MVWQESEVRERFDEFFEAAVVQGPQTVSRGEEEVAVLLSLKEWDALNAKSNLDKEPREMH